MLCAEGAEVVQNNPHAFPPSWFSVVRQNFLKNFYAFALCSDRVMQETNYA
jgi:hypothetical protein